MSAFEQLAKQCAKEREKSFPKELEARARLFRWLRWIDGPKVLKGRSLVAVLMGMPHALAGYRKNVKFKVRSKVEL